MASGTINPTSLPSVTCLFISGQVLRTAVSYLGFKLQVKKPLEGLHLEVHLPLIKVNL
jgi:hypothetical protein